MKADETLRPGMEALLAFLADRIVDQFTPGERKALWSSITGSDAWKDPPVPPAKAGRPRRPVTPTVASRYVMIPLFAAMTGYTDKAVRAKIAAGVWRQGNHYVKAPDGHMLVDLDAYEAWASGREQRK